MSIGDQEPAAIRLHRVLDSCLGIVAFRPSGRPMVNGPLTDIRDDGEALRSIDPIDAVNVAAAPVRVADESDQRIRCVTDERDVHHSAQAKAGLLPGQAAGERRNRSGLGIDARDPAGNSLTGTYKAPSGPTVLPQPPSRPVTNTVMLGAPGEAGAAFSPGLPA